MHGLVAWGVHSWGGKCKVHSVQWVFVVYLYVEHVGGRKQVSKRHKHARPGMHMQQCPAVPHDHRYDTRVLPYNCLHLMAFILSTRPCLYATKQEKAPRCCHPASEPPCVCWHSSAK